MKTIVLSDFTGEQLTRAQQKKQETYHSALRTYRRSEADWSRRVDDVYQRAVAAYEGEIQRWNKMAWFSRLLYGLVHSWPATLLCVVVMGAGLFALVNGIAFWLAVVGLIVIPVIALLYFPGQQPTLALPVDRGEAIWRGPRTSCSRHNAHQPRGRTRSRPRGRAQGCRQARLPAGRPVDPALRVQRTRRRDRPHPRGAAGRLRARGQIPEWQRDSGWRLMGDHTLRQLRQCQLSLFQPVTDRTGHSPSQQLNRAVKPLESFPQAA